MPSSTRAAPPAERPPAASWLEGPYEACVRAIEAFALQRADPPQTQLALNYLQARAPRCGCSAVALRMEPPQHCYHWCCKWHPRAMQSSHRSSMNNFR